MLDYEELVKANHIKFLTEQILNEATTNLCFSGLIDMLALEIAQHPSLRSQLGCVLELTRGILEALFRIEEAGAKCSDEKTRGKALKLLETLTKFYPDSGIAARNYLHALHANGTWRTHRKSEWSITPGLGIRSKDYVGMKNLGATCYMNSSLQQFFMIPQFRKGILEVIHDKRDNNVLYQLRLIFIFLLKSKKTVYNPKAFTQSMKIDKQVLNPFEQKDVDEFIMHFLDQLEHELKGTKQERLVKDTFKLTLANEIICRDCPHRSETNEDAISIIVSVKNKKTLYEGLKAYIEADTLEGDNAYYCERCDKKVAAYKRQNIKTLHNTLIIVLKRFEFNVDTMTRVKVNDCCEFPHELDLEEFTQEGQTCKELNRDIENGRLSQDDLTEDQRKLLKRHIPKYYYKYKLTGIIVHTGSADAGHYYSFILNRDGKGEDSWLEFNDTIVREFDPKNIPEEAFGGEEELYVGYGKKEMFREKIRNAYVLIYERIVPLDAEELDKYKKEEREVDLADIEGRFEAMKIKEEDKNIKIPEDLQQVVNLDNTKFWMTQYIFHPDYLSFVSNMITTQSTIQPIIESSKLEQVDKAQFNTTFLLTVGLRAKNKEKVPTLLDIIKSNCKNDLKHCTWIVTLFSYQEIIQEFLIYCPHEYARRWIVELLKCAMDKLYPLERKQLISLGQKAEIIISAKEICKLFDLPNVSTSGKIELTEIKVPYLWLLMNALMQQIIHIFNHGNGQFFQVFCSFARLGPEARRLLNRCQMFGVAFEYIKSTKDACTLFTSKQIVYLELKGKPAIEPIPKDPSREAKKQLRRMDPQTFALELMYRLILNAEIQRSRPTELKSESFTTKLSATEDSYISNLKELEIIKYILNTSEDNKAAVTFFSKMMAYIAFDNEEHIKRYILFTLDRFKNLDYPNLKPVFRFIYFLMDNQDSYPAKLTTFIEHFFVHFEKSRDYFRIAESYIDFFIKICRNNYIFLASFRTIKNPARNSYIDKMDTWLELNPYPTCNYSVILYNKS